MDGQAIIIHIHVYCTCMYCTHMYMYMDTYTHTSIVAKFIQTPPSPSLGAVRVGTRGHKVLLLVVAKQTELIDASYTCVRKILPRTFSVYRKFYFMH